MKVKTGRANEVKTGRAIRVKTGKMDYRKYSYNGREHDLTPAAELIRKGKWDKMLKTIRKELRCSKAEARTIGNEIKEACLEEIRDTAAVATQTKKKHGVFAILLVVMFLSAVCFGGAYYAYFKLFKQPDMYAMEMQNPDAETSYIGYAGRTYVDDVDSMTDEERQSIYNETKDILDMMENSDGQFFYIEDASDSDGCCLYKTDLETFTGKLNGKELNNINANIGHRVKGFLSMKYSMVTSNEMDWFGGRSGIIPENLALCLGGGVTPVQYFQDRELSLSCDKVTPEKIAVYWEVFSEDELTEDDWPSVFAIYKANVTTEHCIGESVFPPEGETEDMTIKVSAGPGSIDCSFDFIYFK